ncbi:MAG: hypothetical protein QOG15_3096 [Solirubrobacteraceae bacterium]|jgi:hypothetical protein|nr:hypothetical protein [Solirubrobacteraceae bacterium]
MTKLTQMKYRSYPFLIGAITVFAVYGGSFSKH